MVHPDSLITPHPDQCLEQQLWFLLSRASSGASRSDGTEAFTHLGAPLICRVSYEQAVPSVGRELGRSPQLGGEVRDNYPIILPLQQRRNVAPSSREEGWGRSPLKPTKGWAALTPTTKVIAPSSKRCVSLHPTHVPSVVPSVE
jgi:hypothetical protein